MFCCLYICCAQAYHRNRVQHGAAMGGAGNMLPAPYAPSALSLVDRWARTETAIATQVRGGTRLRGIRYYISLAVLQYLRYSRLQ